MPRRGILVRPKLPLFHPLALPVGFMASFDCARLTTPMESLPQM